MRRIWLVCAVLLAAGSIGDGAIGGGSIRSNNGGAAGFASFGGVTEPTFHQPFELSGVDQLPSTLVVNGVTLTNTVDCDASGVSGTVLTCNTGQVFAEYSSGASPTVEAAPFTDGSETMQFSQGKVYATTDDKDLFDLDGNDDVVFEIIARSGIQASYPRVFQAKSSAGVHVESNPAGTAYGVYLNDGVTQIGNDIVCSVLAWCHVLLFVDRDENSTYGWRGFANGALSATTNPYGLAGDTITNNATRAYIAASTGAYDPEEWSGQIASIRQWKCDGCFAGGATNATQWLAIAQERFQRLTGAYPSHAGAPLATTLTRASTATIPIHDATDDVIRLHTVGSNWPRIGSWPSGGWGADPTAAGTSLVGYYSEVGRTNLALQSSDITTTWTDVGTSTQTANAIAAPDGATTADAINGVGTAEQGVTQNVTLTAASYVFSAFAKAGVVDFAYLETAIANTSAYFDLTDCTAGTVGAAANASVEDWGGGWCRIGIRYTGTVAAHAHDVQCAGSDGGKTYAGSTADCYVWGSQVEQNTRASSYIATTTASVSRSDDVMVFDGDNGNTSAGAGALHWAVLMPKGGTSWTTQIASWLFDTGSDLIYDQINSAGNPYTEHWTGAAQWSVTTNITAPDWGEDGRPHYAWDAWDTNNVLIQHDHVLVADTTATNPADAFDKISIGTRPDTETHQLDGMLLYVKVYDERVLGTQVVAAYGDSITRGTPYASIPYPTALAASTSRLVENGGVGGETCGQVNARFTCSSRNYSHVVVMCGVSDLAVGTSAVDIEAQIENIINKADVCNIPMVLMTVSPWEDSSGWTAPRQTQTDALNAWIMAGGHAGDVTPLDVFALLEDDIDADQLEASYDSGDNIHPNNTGQAIIATAVEGAL